MTKIEESAKKALDEFVLQIENAKKNDTVWKAIDLIKDSIIVNIHATTNLMGFLSKISNKKEN